jgi:hypothetical protein
MTQMGILEHLFDIPVADFTRIGLIEADLQLGTELLLDLDGAAVAILNGLPLFVRKLGNHVVIIAWGNPPKIHIPGNAKVVNTVKRPVLAPAARAWSGRPRASGTDTHGRPQ